MESTPPPHAVLINFIKTTLCIFYIHSSFTQVGNQRIITLSETSLVNGTSVKNTTLHFEIPNESDIGNLNTDREQFS